MTTGTEVRCSTCHRTERWSPDGARVEGSAGGVRRSAAPERDALAVVLADPARIVAACPACGQPMVGDGLPAVPWSFAVPGGAVTIGVHGATGATGALSVAVAADTVRAAHPPPPAEPAGRWVLAFQIGLVLLMLGPIAVWLFSVVYVSFFLSHASDAL